jgi:hypothetical protein
VRWMVMRGHGGFRRRTPNKLRPQDNTFLFIGQCVNEVNSCASVATTIEPVSQTHLRQTQQIKSTCVYEHSLLETGLINLPAVGKHPMAIQSSSAQSADIGRKMAAKRAHKLNGQNI